MSAFSEYVYSKQLIDIIRLIRSENVGPVTFFQLLKLYKTAEIALKKIPELASRGGKKKINLASEADILSELSKVEKFGGKVISYFDQDYPQILKHIYDPPPVITVIGNAELLQKKSIAVVGSRNATANGYRIAYKLAKELGENNFVCVSGLARGIDTAVHKATIETGTIAVIAGGIDQIYPPENEELQRQISKENLIITEYPIGMVPVSQNFPRRNRIISGLCLGTLVIEASLKSGSLITAKYALEQGREVFAIPGFPMDPRYHGTNSLIKNGANLVESVEDIISVIEGNNYSVSNLENRQESEYYVSSMEVSDEIMNHARKIILEKLSYNPVSLEDILNYTAIGYNTMLTVILELELSGKLIRHPGNKVSLVFEESKE